VQVFMQWVNEVAKIISRHFCKASQPNLPLNRKRKQISERITWCLNTSWYICSLLQYTWKLVVFLRRLLQIPRQGHLSYHLFLLTWSIALNVQFNVWVWFWRYLTIWFIWNLSQSSVSLSLKVKFDWKITHESGLDGTIVLFSWCPRMVEVCNG